MALNVQIAIIADDITGCLDSAIMLTKQGVYTQVFSYSEFNIMRIDQRTRAVVINTCSRHIEPKAAYERIRSVVVQIKKINIQIVYKKTDSALRGNIGSELSAILEETDKNLFFFPAFPKMGRKTINGVQYIDGIPLAKSNYCNDSRDPMTKSRISEIIGEQTNIPCISVQKNEGIKKIYTNNKEIIIFDADCENDFIYRSKMIATMSEKPVIAGCAGFVEYLTGIVEEDYHFEQQIIKHKKTNEADKYLIVCGTLNSISREQIEYAQLKGYSLITIPVNLDTYEMKRALHEVKKKLAVNDCILLVTPNKKIRMHPLEICRNMAKFVSMIVNYIGNMSLIVFGGDTLQEILNEFKCRQIVPKEEICTGVVLSEMLCDKGEIVLISKSGGFGEKDTVLKIINYFKMHK